jgi:hypothetical protein
MNHLLIFHWISPRITLLPRFVPFFFALLHIALLGHSLLYLLQGTYLRPPYQYLIAVGL